MTVLFGKHVHFNQQKTDEMLTWCYASGIDQVAIDVRRDYNGPGWIVNTEMFTKSLDDSDYLMGRVEELNRTHERPVDLYAQVVMNSSWAWGDSDDFNSAWMVDAPVNKDGSKTVKLLDFRLAEVQQFLVAALEDIFEHNPLLHLNLDYIRWETGVEWYSQGDFSHEHIIDIVVLARRVANRYGRKVSADVAPIWPVGWHDETTGIGSSFDAMGVGQRPEQWLDENLVDSVWAMNYRPERANDQPIELALDKHYVPILQKHGPAKIVSLAGANYTGFKEITEKSIVAGIGYGIFQWNQILEKDLLDYVAGWTSQIEPPPKPEPEVGNISLTINELTVEQAKNILNGM